MMRFDSVNVTCGNNVLSIDSLTITCGIGKGYNTATLSGLDLTCEVGDIIEISINNEVYSFLVFEKVFGKNTTVNLVCKGVPAKLDDEGFVEASNNYSNSLELINDCSRDVSTIISIPTISFQNQTYVKTNTSLACILDMVDVVGGEAYEYKRKLYLEELQRIPANPTIACDFDNFAVFSYNYSNKVDKFLKAKKVIINPITDDLYSEPNIQFDYSGLFGTILFNPSLSSNLPYEIVGLEYDDPIFTFVTENIMLDNQTSLKLKAGVDDIEFLFIDGVPFSDYESFDKTNVLRFLTPQTGSLEIKYKTKSIKVHITQTSDFSISYQCMRISGQVFLTEQNYTCIAELLNNKLTYTTGGVMRINKGVDVSFIFLKSKTSSHLQIDGTITLIGGGTLTLKHRDNGGAWDTSFEQNITSQIAEINNIENSMVVYDENLGEYVIYLSNTVKTITSVHFGSSIILGWSFVDDVQQYLIFDSSHEGKTYEISFLMEVVDVTIPPPLENHPVTILDVIGCNGVSSFEFTKVEDDLCHLPVTFDINVYSLLNRQVDEVVGKEITSPTLGNFIVSSNGTITVTIETRFEHVLDCEQIVPLAEIVINSQGVA